IRRWGRRRFPALLAIQSASCGRAIDDNGSRTIRAGENNIRARRLHLAKFKAGDIPHPMRKRVRGTSARARKSRRRTGEFFRVAARYLPGLSVFGAEVSFLAASRALV